MTCSAARHIGDQHSMRAAISKLPQHELPIHLHQRTKRMIARAVSDAVQPPHIKPPAITCTHDTRCIPSPSRVYLFECYNVRYLRFVLQSPV